MMATTSRAVLVVGVDLTDVSEHLVRTARALARTVDEADIHFVHVVPPPPLTLVPSDVLLATTLDGDDRVDEARAALEDMCASVADDVRVKIFVHTPIGRPFDALAEIARRVNANLIVVEAHDHTRESALRRAFHRSVAARLARSGPCSVLTVRPRGVAWSSAHAGAAS